MILGIRNLVRFYEKHYFITVNNLQFTVIRALADTPKCCAHDLTSETSALTVIPPIGPWICAGFARQHWLSGAPLGHQNYCHWFEPRASIQEVSHTVVPRTSGRMVSQKASVRFAVVYGSLWWVDNPSVVEPKTVKMALNGCFCPMLRL